MNLLFVIVTTLAAITLSTKGAAVPYLPVPHDAAVILDTGSTNALGYRVVVRRNGNIEYVRGNARGKATIGADVAKQFFDDLGANMPLSALQTGRCMKSASFGTSLFVWWRGSRSPDLTCPGDQKASVIAAEVRGVVIASHLPLTPVKVHSIDVVPLPSNEPRRPDVTPWPLTTPSH